jgi:Fis family transcriptional regulator
MSEHPIDENEMARYVRQALSEYFQHLEGEQPSSDLYDMVMHCVEKPLLEMVLAHVGGKQTRASEILGINRNTLRKKMQEFNIK